MAQYDASALKISFGGSDITSMVLAFNGFKITGKTEDGTPFGTAWMVNVFGGLKNGADITLDTFYDDTVTTGSNAIFNAVGTTVAMIITWGGTKTSAFSALIGDYERLPKIGAKTRAIVTMKITGAVTEV